jgi:hypothetical protein
VAVLRRVLYPDALVTSVVSIALIAVPGTVLRVLGQPAPADQGWLRLLGVAGLTLSLLMVLVAHRVEELWWWCWAFVILNTGIAAVATLHAAFGLPEGAAAWLWWVLGAGSWGLAGLFLWGIARAGVEAPPP